MKFLLLYGTLGDSTRISSMQSRMLGGVGAIPGMRLLVLFGCNLFNNVKSFPHSLKD